MTLGERIQELRKNAGLSQEALGETLGVTRQSISKWESDAAIPELDKLIAMSKLFRVPMGALLGVEDGGEPDKELTERELAALSAIAEKLTPEPPKRKRWPKVLAALAVIALFAAGTVLGSRLTRLEQQMNSVQYHVNSINQTVSLQISGITDRVEQILESQNSVTADKGYSIVDADLKAGTVTLQVWAVPKTYREGMTASFTVQCADRYDSFPRYVIMENGSPPRPAKTLQPGPSMTPADSPAAGDYSPVTVQGKMTADLRFEALVTCPLTNDITLSVTFRSGEESRTQLLDRVTYLLESSIPKLHTAGIVGDITVPKGEDPALIWVHPWVWVYPGVHPVTQEEVAVASLTLRLWRGDMLIWSQEVDPPKVADDRWGLERNDARVELPGLEVGEVLYLSALATDETARQYEVLLDGGAVEAGRTVTAGGVTTIYEYHFSPRAPLVAEIYPWEK